jgi:outer membrane protein assembly factor BamB
MSREASARDTTLRLWPGVVSVALQWAAWLGPSVVLPEVRPYGMLVAVGAGLAFVLWWLLFSRAPWSDRVGVLVLMVGAILATRRVVHESIAGAGMGMLLYVYSLPVQSLALVVAIAASRRLSVAARRATMGGAIVLASGVFTLVRTGGISGEGESELHWRWSATPEERLLSRTGDEPVGRAGAAPGSPAASWPGFRGAERAGLVRGVRLETDWSRSPPLELWRRPVGPGWSSFAVRGDLVYTQEQRGEQETVSCYRMTSGEPVWRHADAVRFWESNAGAGPRGTPSIDDGRVYTLGATGIVNALDAGSGAVVWTRDAASDTGKKTPEWGFAGSPLVTGDLVVVAVAGQLVAYDAATGRPRWFGPPGGAGYSSPHAATIAGVAQVLLLSGGGAISLAPADGRLLWEHSWQRGAGIVQPAITDDGGVLITACSAMGGIGLRRLGITQRSSAWTIEERWTSRGLKPYFNDFVVHDGHAFGFDGSILACIELEGGTRRWKGGRYGHGQLLLLPDQDVLLILSEEGELALVAATPERLVELARFRAIEGKTWNHPALAGDVLLVRNSEEMAAFRLTLARG